MYKVDSSGDHYIAVCGLPDPCSNHATIISNFALACMREFDILTRRLELTLGPDTSTLGLCIGLNSGPITAGVLRGERSRFSLFGM